MRDVGLSQIAKILENGLFFILSFFFLNCLNFSAGSEQTHAIFSQVDSFPRRVIDPADPALDTSLQYLVDSADKEYDGESLRCHKQLRAYQLFDEGHLHDIELNTFDSGTMFYFVLSKMLARPGDDKICSQVHNWLWCKVQMCIRTGESMFACGCLVFFLFSFFCKDFSSRLMQAVKTEN